MRDNYFDTGVNKSQTFEYSTSPASLSPALFASVPAQFRQPAGYSNLPRISINEFDITSRNFVDLSLTQMVNAAGQHQFKGGFGYSRATNDVNLAYPNNGYVTVFWDSTFTSDVPGVGSGTGTYGYYTIDDFGTKGKTGANILSLYRAGQLDGHASPDAEHRSPHGERGHPVVPSGHPGSRYPLRVEREALATPRLCLQPLRRRPGRRSPDRAAAYYDWTKYELARGTFGGDIWTTRYRTLDDPDVSKLSRAALTGRNLWTNEPDSYKDSRIPSFGADVVDPNMKPMAQDSYNLGFEYQVKTNTVFGVNFVRTDLIRTIEDIGTLVNGSEAYIYGNPGEGLATTAITTGATPPFDTAEGEAELHRPRVHGEPPLQQQLVPRWQLRVSAASTATIPVSSTPTKSRLLDASAVGAQEAFGQRTRPGTNASRAWDLDEMMFDSHGNLGVDGRLPTDRPHVVKVYGSYLFKFGTNLGLNFYGGSGTPISKSVQSIYRYPILVEGRGSLGRTDALTQTDLLVSHEFGVGGTKKIRLEFNALNIFNQEQVRHVFDTVNRIGANGRVLPSSALTLASENLLNGYNYDAILATRPDAAKPAGSPGAGTTDPRYQMGDIFNPGFDGRFTASLPVLKHPDAGICRLWKHEGPATCRPFVFDVNSQGPIPNSQFPTPNSQGLRFGSWRLGCCELSRFSCRSARAAACR